jgi:hypothetical protein
VYIQIKKLKKLAKVHKGCRVIDDDDDDDDDDSTVK